jgi:hypothetical protein
MLALGCAKLARSGLARADVGTCAVAEPHVHRHLTFRKSVVLQLFKDEAALLGTKIRKIDMYSSQISAMFAQLLSTSVLCGAASRSDSAASAICSCAEDLCR